MKLLIGLLVVVALLIPSAVVAQCEMPCSCIEYCEDLTFDYKVRYKEPVFLYFEQWGFGYWTSEWVSVIVEAHDEFEAAESLGLLAGYDCWVTKVF